MTRTAIVTVLAVLVLGLFMLGELFPRARRPYSTDLGALRARASTTTPAKCVSSCCCRLRHVGPGDQEVDGEVVEDSEHALGAGWGDGVVERGREVADDQTGAEDRASRDVPAVAAQSSMHHHHDEGSHRERRGDARGDAVGDLLAQGVLATDDGACAGCRHRSNHSRRGPSCHTLRAGRYSCAVTARLATC